MEVIVTPSKFNGNSRSASENSKLQKRFLNLFGESPEAPKTCSNISERYDELFGPSPTEKSKSESPVVRSNRNLKKNLFGDSPQKKEKSTSQRYVSVFGDAPTKLKLKKISISHPVEKKEEKRKNDEAKSLKSASKYETPPKIKPNGLPITPGSEFKIPVIPKSSKSKSTRHERDERFLEEIFKEMCMFDMPKLVSPLKKTPEKIPLKPKFIKGKHCNLHGEKTSKKHNYKDKELESIFEDASIFNVPKMLSPLKKSPEVAKTKTNLEKTTGIYELSLPEDGQIFTGNNGRKNGEIEDLYEQFCFITQFDDLKTTPKKVYEVSLNKVPKYLGKIKQSGRGECIKV